MKILFSLILLSLSIQLSAQVNHRRVRFQYRRDQTWQTLPGIMHMPAGYRDSATRKFPLIVFLHGAGEGGNTNGSELTKLTTIQNASIPYLIAQGNWPDSFLVNGTWHHPVVFSPQFPGWSADGQQTEALINWAINNYSIDTTRIYVTGLSAGGIGTTNYAARTISSSGNPKVPVFNRPAAILPMAQADAASNVKAIQIVADSIPSWGFGDPAGDTHGASQQLQQTYIVNNGGFGRFTSYTGGHCCFLQFYTPTYTQTFTYKGVSKTRTVYEWMLENQRVASTNPVVGAGSDQVINLPTSSVSLSATVNPGSGATLSSVAWTKTSGPTATITSASSQATTVTALTAGTYVFRLTATNSNSLTGFDEVQVTVNDLDPTVTVNSPTITLPTSTAAVTSTPVTNFTISTRAWTKLKSPGQAAIKVAVVGSSTAGHVGTTTPDSGYVNRLKKYYTDLGVVTTIANHAIGGTSVFDINFTTAFSTNPNILIVDYPSNAFDGATYTVTQIAQQFQKIKDSCTARGIECWIMGPITRDDFSSANRTKLKVIGDTLALRFTNRYVDRFAAMANVSNDNEIKAEFKVSGDIIHYNNNGHRHLADIAKGANIFQSLVSNAATISTPTTQNTNITSFSVAGAYLFQHSIKDSRGYHATAVSTVTVVPSAQVPPVAGAGSDQTITLPTNSVSLAGTATDADGTITSRLWSQQSGPTTANITTPTLINTTVTGLSQGVYVFRLLVTDNSSLTHFDDMSVTVNAQPGPPIIKKIGATEYSCFWLYSDSVVRAYIFNNSTNKVEITPINIGGRKAVDVSVGFNRPIIIDDQSYVWVGSQGSANPTRVNLDTTNTAFTGNTKIAGYFFTYTSIRSDGSIWYWGGDDYNLYAGSNTITNPIKLSPNGVVFTKVHMGKTILALSSTGVVYQWFKDGSLTATQHTFARPAIDIFGGHSAFYGAIVPDASQPTTSGYPYVWGTSPGHWGGTVNYGSPTDIRSLWNLTVPIKRIEANHMTIAYIDTTGKLFTTGYNANGELGIGVELVNRAEQYATPYNWVQALEDFYPAPPQWIRQDKTFKEIYSSNIYTFYWWAIDTNDKAYHWGRSKSFVAGNGIAHDKEDPFPNGLDYLTPIERNPLTASPAVTITWTKNTLNAGRDTSIYVDHVTLSAIGTPTTGTEISEWLWVNVSTPGSNVGGTIVNPTAQETEIIGLTPGIYFFDVQMKDTNNGTITDRVVITVLNSTQRKRIPKKLGRVFIKV